MKFVDLVSTDLVALDVKNGDYEAVFLQLVQPLLEKGLISDRDELVHELSERERLMSTAIKKGVAIPHAFTSQVTEPVVVVGRSDEGCDFHSFDGSPTHCFFLLVEPASGQVLHLRLLSQISQIVSDQNFMPAFRAAQSPRELVDLLQ